MNTFGKSFSLIVMVFAFQATLIASPLAQTEAKDDTIKKGEIKPQPLTKDRILMGLVSNHTRVFSKDDLFAESLQPHEWYRYLNEIKKFVAENGKGDQKLTGALDIILTANDTMINSIKVAYNALFAPGASYQEAVAKSTLQKLEQVMAQMASVQKTIIKESFVYKSKKEVREVLEQFALVSEITAQKAANDLRKRMPK